MERFWAAHTPSSFFERPMSGNEPPIPATCFALSAFPILIYAWYSSIISMYLSSLTPHNVCGLPHNTMSGLAGSRDDGGLPGLPPQLGEQFPSKPEAVPSIRDIRFRLPHLTLT